MVLLMERTLCYSYSKQENFTIDDPEMLQFTHLLMEAKSKYSPNIKPYLKTHDIIDSIDGFSHVTLNNNILLPMKIKTKPSIFIMKRKSNIKYDPNKARSRTSVKDLNQVDDTKNSKINKSLEEQIVKKFTESTEELEKTKETVEHNFLDTELEENDTIEKKVEGLNDLADGNMTSTENTTTWESKSINELSANSRNKNKDDIDSQEDFKDASDINDVKSDKKTKIEEQSIIKGKSKNGVNLRQETHGVKQTVKKMIQEKMLEAKQRREVNDERKSMELPIKPMKKKGIAELLKSIGVFKPELKEPSISDKLAIMEEEPEIVKEYVKDDELSKQELVIQKKDKIKVIKSDTLEQTEDIMEEENKIVDVKIDTKKIVKSRDKIDAELPATEAEIIEEDKEESIKTSKSINVRESIRNIINQFKEFEKDFIHDDADSVAPTNDINKNRIESNSRVTEMDYSVESNGQLMVKDARESLKEIIDQFKYIKHELTSEEDDHFDEIAAKYMERPIAETLLQFSEALKALIQRRKKTSSKEHAANLYDNKGTYKSENQRKLIVEETNVNSNDVKFDTTREKESSQKSIKSPNE